MRLSGGGELTSAAPASGPVQIAIQPWQLELVDPDACSLTDTVLSVRRDRGELVIRLSRVTIQIPANARNHAPAEGSLVGLRAAPQDVHVLPPGR